MEFFTDMPNQIHRLPLFAVTMLASVCLGLTLRRTKLVSERYVLVIVVGFNSFCYWLLGDVSTISFKTRHPEAVLAVYGLIFGVLAWTAYKPLAKKFFPSLLEGTNGTQFFKKPEGESKSKEQEHKQEPPPANPT